MAFLKQLVVDCRQPVALARFWAATLEGFEIRGYDDAEIARLACVGRTPEDDPCVIVDGPGLEIWFLEVDVRDVARKPLLVDLATTDRAEETTRLMVLGASIVEKFDTHAWMRDPEGSDFCVTDA